MSTASDEEKNRMKNLDEDLVMYCTCQDHWIQSHRVSVSSNEPLCRRVRRLALWFDLVLDHSASGPWKTNIINKSNSDIQEQLSTLRATL